MKRLIAIALSLILVMTLFITGCSNVNENQGDNQLNNEITSAEATTDSNNTGSEDNLPDDNQQGNTNPDDNQPGNTNPDDNQQGNTNPDDNQPGNTNPDDNQSGNTNPDDNQQGNTNPDDNQQGNTNPDDNQQGNTNPDDNQSGTTNPDDNQSGNTNPDDNQSGNTNPDDNQSGTTNPDDNQSGNTNPDDNQSGDNDQTTHTHSYKTTVTAPTCKSEGYTTYSCSCGDSYVGDTVAKLAHTEVAVTGKAATCTESGLTNGRKCSVCYTVTLEQTVIAATGHSWTAATTEAPKTCTTCGATEGDKLPGSSSGGSSSGGSSSSGYGETLYVSYIDVGQGDSILIKVGDCDILIDAGTSSYGSTVTSYLRSQGVDDIELLINSHPDSDHYGGLPAVLDAYTVEKIWMSSYAKTGTTYTSFKSKVNSEGCPVSTPSVGTVYTYEYLTLTVIYNGSGATNSNDSSLVIMLEYGSFRFLFTGDISSTVESKLVSGGNDLSCDVLKVPHHGSAGSSSSSFLNATGADYGVICVGEGNSYGHPKSEALNRLSSAGITVYRTDLKGHIVFHTDGASMTTPGGVVGGETGSGSGVVPGGSTSGGSSSGSTTGAYVANSSTKVYHLPSCGHAPTTNKIYIDDTTGYTPCSYCIGSSSGTTYIANSSTKVYHLPSCSYAPTTNKITITNTAGYTPCSRCIGSSGGGTTYIANSSTKVYHLPSCSYAPTTNKITITSTAGYTPCSHCIGSSSTKTYILNKETGVYHLSTCSYLPVASKRQTITSTSGYKACGHCLG